MKRKLVLAFAVVLAALAGVAYAINHARGLEGAFDTNVPSAGEVERQVEQYYTRHRHGDVRPRGELVGCPDRSARLWYDCEFDDPTHASPKRVTCVHIYVDEPCCSWEQGRRTLSPSTAARQSPCA